MTITEITQGAASQLVALAVARQTRNLILDNTDVATDSIKLKIVPWVVGETAAMAARPLTDRAVVRAATWIKSRRNKPETP